MFERALIFVLTSNCLVEHGRVIIKMLGLTKIVKLSQR